MDEKPVFWMGGSPTKPKAVDPADHTALAATLRTACAERGLKGGEFLASSGSFGSWLLPVARQNLQQRLVWNGKDKKLVLQTQLEHGEWLDQNSTAISQPNTDAFIAALEQLFPAADKA